MGSCAIPGCPNLGDVAGNGRRMRMCATHRKRQRKGLAMETPIRAHFRRDPEQMVSYKSAHGRVRHVRGPASSHACVDCQAPAREWSFDHRDSNPQVDSEGRRYSLDSEHYAPRCRVCHVAFDAHHRSLVEA